MKRLLKIAMFTLVMISFTFSFVNAQTLNDIWIKVPENLENVIVNDSEYGWTYKWINGKTKAETFGFTTNSADLWRTNEWQKDDNKKDEKLNAKDWEVLRLTSNSQKGKVGIIYHNVGSYKGKDVSIKITLIDWKNLGKGGQVEVDGEKRQAYPSVYFSKTSIDVLTTYRPLILKPKWKIQFFYEEDKLQSPLSIKGHVTIKDLDNEEYMISDFSKIDKLYVTNDTNLVKDSNNSTIKNKEGDEPFQTWDKNNWATMFFDTSKMEDKAIVFVYSDTKKDKTDPNPENVANQKNYYQWLLTPDSLVVFPTPKIYKTVNKTDITQGENLSYTLSYYVPMQPETGKFKSFTVTDTVEACLDVKEVKVINENNTDVTNQFTVTIKNNNVKIDAKKEVIAADDFYNKNYSIRISCDLKDNPELKSKIEDGKYVLKNKAELKTDKGTETSTEVKTGLHYKVETEIVNGTITPSDLRVVPTTDKLVAYTPDDGYYVKSVEIDGEQIDVSKVKDGGKYIFKNINANHKVVVVCERIPATVIVKYIDIDTGKELTEQKVIDGFINDEYKTEEMIIEGYDFLTEKYPENANGKMLEEETEVIYYYKAIENPDTSDINVKLHFVMLLINSLCIVYTFKKVLNYKK